MRLAETLEQVLLDLIRRHELGAEGTVEPWRRGWGGHKDQKMSPQSSEVGVAALRHDLALARAGEL